MKDTCVRLIKLAIALTGLIFTLRSFYGDSEKKNTNLIIGAVCMILSNIELPAKKVKSIAEND
ncbi:MAG: hypothetical protein NC340_03585 [Ruminococcus flavefaciens]|nr:hypothetical protein [Ruminococcus flavefaciens]MCM1229637.1 hypothetical protein [Ruminococcus flavefaciens]